MRKVLYAFGAAMLLCLCTTAWGSLHVTGELFGVWPAGDTVFVEGPSGVPSGKSLLVEAGAVVVIKDASSLVVAGTLEVRGTASDSVVLIPMEGWEGFYFPPNESAIQVFQYVVVPVTAPLPLRLLVSEGALLRVENCSLRASRGVLTMAGGRLWASRNRFVLTGECQYFSTVYIHYLINDRTRCSAEGNRFTENIVKVEGATLSSYQPRVFTSGLWVDGSTRLCMWNNAISVDAYGNTIGAYFGDGLQGETTELDSCVVAVISRDGSPRGIYNANEGDLRVRRCTVDVAEMFPDNPAKSAGILASNQAQVEVNSTTVNLDRDTLWFYPYMGGHLSVDFLTRWSSDANSGFTGNSPSENSIVLDIGDVAMNLMYGDHIYTADPRFLRQGVWGEWTTLDDVAAYYGIQSTSPCIDRGDVLYGYDPDNTLPDIGRYHYSQTVTSSGDLPAGIPTLVQLLPAYPNPFNGQTTIPFTIQKNGDVAVTVFDVHGRRIGSLQSGKLSAGSHTVRFSGDGIASGTYLVRVVVDGVPAGNMQVIHLK